MINKITVLKTISVFLLIFVFFEIIGHAYELFYIESYFPYYEYLQIPIVSIFYWVTLILLIAYCLILIYILFQKIIYLNRSIRLTILIIGL